MKCGYPINKSVAKTVPPATQTGIPVFDTGRGVEVKPVSEKKSGVVSLYEDDEPDEFQKKANRAETVKALVSLAAICFTGVVLWSIFCNDAGSASSAKAPAPVKREKGWLPPEQFRAQLQSAPQISTEQLRKDYRANEIRFQRDMVDRPFIITGKIVDIRRGSSFTDGGGTYMVQLEGGILSSTYVVYPESIPSVERNYISSLEKGHIFKAFVVMTNKDGRPNYVDVVNTTVNGQWHTERFPATPPPTLEERLRGASSFMEGFMEGFFGGR